MKLMVSAKPFTAELKSVLPAIATRSGLPILSGIRLEASDGDVSIEATDLELTARRVIRGAVTVDGAGSVVVPAKALVKAVAAMGEPEIVLESHSSDGQAGLDVRAGTRTVSLQGWPTDDWPAVPQIAAIDPIASIEASAVVDAFERVALCASSDEARPVLTCVALLFRDDPAALEVVATDSYRLGVAQIPVEAVFRVSDGPLLVPARAIRLLAKQLKGAGGAVQVRALEASGGDPSRASRIAFSFPDAEWTVRTVEGEFPNWKQVVPTPEGGSFEFDPGELGTALRAATAVRSTGVFGTPEELADDVERRIRRIGSEDLAPWVKLGSVVFRARTITEKAGRVDVVAQIRDRGVLAQIEGMRSDRWGRTQEGVFTYSGRVHQSRVEEVEVTTSAGAGAGLRLSLTTSDVTPDALSEMSVSNGGRTYTAQDLTEMGLRRSLFGEAIPLDDFTGHMATIADPLTSIAGTGLSEEIIRPIVHLLLTEALVAGGRAARITRLRLGPSMAGRRRFELAWEAPRRYDNVEPERRQIEGMVRLEA